MIKLPSQKNDPGAHAKIVESTLIVSLPNAISPIVWRWDLSDVKASAMEIVEENNAYKIVLKLPKGQPQDIASFANRDEAMDALMKVSKALELSGPLKSQSSKIANDENTSGSKIWVGLAVILLIFGLFLWMGSGNPVASTQTNAQNQSSGPNDIGVPLSADD